MTLKTFFIPFSFESKLFDPSYTSSQQVFATLISGQCSPRFFLDFTCYSCSCVDIRLTCSDRSLDNLIILFIPVTRIIINVQLRLDEPHVVHVKSPDNKRGVTLIRKCVDACDNSFRLRNRQVIAVEFDHGIWVVQN